jgi:hypothetical protein
MADLGVYVSVGTLAKFYKQYCPGCYSVHFGYGSGPHAFQGRTQTEKFTCVRNGEVYVKVNGTWKKEYIAKMQDKLNEDRKILKQLNSSEADLVVHHKNFNHLDNRKSNLKVMSREDHSRLHMLKLLKGKNI